ncbi:hypothetical protein [Paractinoplanes durhamensis]|uniref:Uncharacterized protein n=1 Tax=Paractinoplanes durhamensis TaxID=113563 RepID=A0ABQ3ZBD0_9ACTN|nr:hypothetical protein [Actinoplanes durhamensis]GIE07148.1 hypothetical protein Adu01nite_84980 [Actinoplanes durhamensis]
MKADDTPAQQPSPSESPAQRPGPDEKLAGPANPSESPAQRPGPDEKLAGPANPSKSPAQRPGPDEKLAGPANPSKSPAQRAEPGKRPAKRAEPGDAPLEILGNDAGSGALIEFAHTYPGYDRHGGLDGLTALAAEVRETWQRTGDLPDDIETLRACMFQQARAHRFMWSAEFDELPFVLALLDRLREVTN